MIQSVLLVLNLFVLEAMLSVDNAAVLAVLVEGLPGTDSKKALKYGIWGAYIMRGLALFIASWLVGLWWLKVIGGIYLCYLTWAHFWGDSGSDEAVSRQESGVYNWGRRLGLSQLWSTIILVELMDMVFSIDNIFASVALTDKLWAIWAGVFMGIAAMRFVAMWFVNLMRKYPSLETSAYVVIGLLGLKLMMSGIAYKVALWAFGVPPNRDTQKFDLIFSAVMMGIFFVPILFRNPFKGLSEHSINKVKESERYNDG
jgi:YkoY family integral membrane protein